MLRSQSKNSVLSYHDCLLRQEDLHLLNGPFWLNDALIGFYFEYLQHKYEDSKSKMLFLSPELTQLLKLTDSHEYGTFLDPISAKNMDYIFFPVNDCSSRESAGGSHWTLMVFSKPERTCFYFDSSSSSNTAAEADFSKGIMSYLLENGNGQFVEVKCPQQKNGYDCGLFVLCFTDVIAEHILEASQIEGCNCESVQSLVSRKRESLISLIHKLKESNP
ncbi:hypothetical protein QAD02_000341 [Eretmocerus hayati]|uniref:Uncharacterized protein n=1 Tax=Eretmocerus hayati TaxID=131215 RepID=A0ACC2NDC0_9HYME|nr:hypothetical protein QAD02_000341 [Eretmocerus hayati]